MYVFYNLKTPVWLKNLQNKTEFKNAIWKRNILIIFSNYYTEKKKIPPNDYICKCTESNSKGWFLVPQCSVPLSSAKEALTAVYLTHTMLT